MRRLRRQPVRWISAGERAARPRWRAQLAIACDKMGDTHVGANEWLETRDRRRRSELCERSAH
jgi:hypothetical protein